MSHVVATAGHVDHGKSTLVRALTGTDPDRLAEEQRRGLTIELGFAHTVLPSGEVLSLVDVPGHVRFLRNMLAGVGAVSACIFVVAANEGWKPQSEEHLRILDVLGIRYGVVVLTKCDLVEPAGLEAVRRDVADWVEGTFLDGAPVVPTAAPNGTWRSGRDELLAALDDLVATLPEPADHGRPRLWIDRVFAKAGSGTVVTGTSTGGAITTGDALVVWPSGRRVRVRAMQARGAAVEEVGPGERVALNLAGVDHGEISRGDVLVAPDQWHVTSRVDASLEVLAGLGHDVSRRGAYVAYLGAGEQPVRVRVLGPDAIAPGTGGLVRLHLPVGLPLLPGDRFVLRDAGRDETVGGGELLDVAPMLPASRAAPDRSIDRVVVERGWVEADELLRLTGEAVAPNVGRWVVAPPALETARRDLVVRTTAAGPGGLPVAGLDARRRALAATMPTLRVDGTSVRLAEAMVAPHPVVEQLRLGRLAPPDVPDVSRGELRQLQREGVLVERDGRWFHSEAIVAAAALAASLLRDSPGGFGVSRFREAAGITRKHAVPLVAELDARGITRRRGDIHVGGPRLPASG